MSILRDIAMNRNAPSKGLHLDRARMSGQKLYVTMAGGVGIKPQSEKSTGLDVMSLLQSMAVLSTPETREPT